MGNKFELYGWMFQDGDYRYVLIWCGQSYIKMMYYLLHSKFWAKIGCVKLEWR